MRALACLCVFVPMCVRHMKVSRLCVGPLCVRVCVRARLYVCLCVPRRCAGSPMARRGAAVSKAWYATRERVFRPFHRSIAVVAAGASWTSRTTSAQWAARGFHTSVVDAISGAIYVLGGGIIGGAHYNDAWVSSDGGAGRTRGVLGVLKGYRGV